MGSWGVELFEDDTACDVRDDYWELIEDGVADDDATRQVLEHYREALDDDGDAAVVWLALAVSQWEIGRLSSEVRDKALAVIESGADLDRLSESGGLVAQRRAVLDDVRERLLRPQPERKRLLRPPRRYVTNLQAGDVLSFHGSNGRIALLRVALIDEDRHSVAPIVKVLEYSGYTEPDADQLALIGDRERPNIDPPPSPSPPWWSVEWRAEADEGIDYAEAGFRLLATIPPRPGDGSARAWTFGSWSSLARTLDRDLLSEGPG